MCLHIGLGEVRLVLTSYAKEFVSYLSHARKFRNLIGDFEEWSVDECAYPPSEAPANV